MLDLHREKVRGTGHTIKPVPSRSARVTEPGRVVCVGSAPSLSVSGCLD